MDYRIEKTKRSIYDAFISLRENKPLEKLTVKELCEAADINKSTFYVYYHDVYDLSDKIENEIITKVIKSLGKAEEILSDSAGFSRSLFLAYDAQSTLISTVFSGTRAQQLPKKIEAAIKETIFMHYPQYRSDLDFNIKLTYSIYGGYYAYAEYRMSEKEKAIGIVGELSAKVMNQMGR